MRLLFVSCCLLAVSRNASVTTVIAIRTVSSITIGSDSRENDGNRALPKPFCKILQSGEARRFWASAQIFKEPLSGFDVEVSVNRASARASSMSQWVMAFDGQIVAELRRTVRIVKIRNPARFRNTYAGKYVFEIVFGGFENGVPILFYRDYRADAQGNLMEPTKVDCPGETCKGQAMRFCLGECAEADEVSRRDAPLSPSGIVPGIRRQISGEIEANWTVGPPIDVLEIDRAGVRWVDKEPLSKCQPIKP